MRLIYKTVLAFDCANYLNATDGVGKLSLYHEDLKKLDYFSVSSGGPAHGPYLIMESEDLFLLVKCNNTVKNYLNKFKGIKYE